MKPEQGSSAKALNHNTKPEKTENIRNLKPEDWAKIKNEEFINSLKGLKFKRQTIDIAYAVLIEGRKQAEFVRSTGLTKGAISQLVSRVKAALQKQTKTTKNKHKIIVSLNCDPPLQKYTPPNMTSEEFEATIQNLKIGKKTIDIAYAVLIEGRKQAEFVRSTGLTKGAISQLVSRVKNAWLKRVPEGFERITVTLPAQKALIVKQWAQTTEHKNETRTKF